MGSLSHEKRQELHMTYRLRTATLADECELSELIARSIRTLGLGDYSSDQIEAALTGAFGLDTSLIRDGTYIVAVTDLGKIVGCGGWSRRRTLFGSDSRGARDDTLLDPRSEPARIRAFFIDPEHARRGIGRAILENSEADAIRAGFSALELMATLPGRRLYERFGYVAQDEVQIPLPHDLHITFVPMRKDLQGNQNTSGQR
jgi:GNAT superfamily N-acetyltransferase